MPKFSQFSPVPLSPEQVSVRHWSLLYKYRTEAALIVDRPLIDDQTCDKAMELLRKIARLEEP